MGVAMHVPLVSAVGFCSHMHVQVCVALRHTVVCQRPRNMRNQEIRMGTPVCYLCDRSSS